MRLAYGRVVFGVKNMKKLGGDKEEEEDERF